MDTTSTTTSSTMRCTSCVLGNHTGTNGTAGCMGGNCPCPCRTTDPLSRNLEHIVDHLTRTGFAHIAERDVALYLTEADDLTGMDLWADEDGALVFWDAEGNIGAQSSECDFDGMDADDLAAMTPDQAVTWILDATR